MQKRLGILIIIFVLFLGIQCRAQSQFSPTLTKIENSLFGMTYDSQSDDARLKRIEEAVYGSASTGSESQRVAKLSKDLSADQMGQEIKAKKDTFEEDDDAIKELTPKADKSVNYPIVNALEQKVYNKDFRQNDINQRLSTLEQKIFSKTYNDDLNTRVERLKTAIMPERVAQEANYKDDDEDGDTQTPKYYENEDILSQNSPSYGPHGNNPTTDNLWDDFKNAFKGKPSGGAVSMPTYNENNSVLDDYQDNSDVIVHLGAVEKSILKKSFPDDSVDNRLARLELNVFNTTFTDDDEVTRLERVASAYKAKKSSKRYDNNKFSQNVSTAMQIGAFLLVILAAIL